MAHQGMMPPPTRTMNVALLDGHPWHSAHEVGVAVAREHAELTILPKPVLYHVPPAVAVRCLVATNTQVIHSINYRKPSCKEFCTKNSPKYDPSTIAIRPLVVCHNFIVEHNQKTK